ncbi:hypothetical protein AMAG_09543 [Allomyces macrogynus ATCC 38327]|uniref:Helicase ATP-binding domain-containing protein n=1 Tax=Allomyces macrogynus (strain ATCC 38327) TaxID=578462 RepID=A0A0L0SPV6_ALLM3|nr:hypothetical protein AMAG_09543 [Allomyces macrogynus ATCC 38327]|eukprot:KNE64526.1 hypothetical protein AMAG_09543 [Allomyces macrogynus ATCC 38327]
MPATRRKAAAAAAAAAASSSNVSAPAPPATLRRSTRTRTTCSTSVFTPVEPLSELEDELDTLPELAVEEPKRKRQRRQRSADADVIPANVRDESVDAAGPSHFARRARPILRGPLLRTPVEARPLSAEHLLGSGRDDTPEPVPVPIRSKRKRKAANNEPDVDDWVPHAIDELVPDQQDGPSHSVAPDSQSQQHHSITLGTSSTSQQPAQFDGVNEDVPDDATSWWRFYPDVPSTTLDGNGLAELDANTDADALLNAAVNNHTGRNQWHDYDHLPFSSDDAAAADALHARVLVDDDTEDTCCESAPVKADLRPNANELFLHSQNTSLRLRLPMSPTSIDMNTFRCLKPTALADVTARIVPILRVRRPQITADGYFAYPAWGLATENVWYAHPDSSTMPSDELHNLTVADFAAVEALDPYTERAKCVRPTEGREGFETLRSDGFVDAKMGIDRMLSNQLVFVLNKDAFCRHDGDWPEEPGTNFHQESYAAGRLVIALAGLRNLGPWTAAHDPYYRIVLRSIKKTMYPPPDATPGVPQYANSNDLQVFNYEVCFFLKTDAANAALRDGLEVPGFRDRIKQLFHLFETRNRIKLPNFYVPDTLEGGHAPVLTPPGFQLDLYDYQQRTLSWLLELERSRRARTVHARQVTAGTTAEQKTQFLESEMRLRPNWIQLGPGGMWINTATFETAADPVVWADRHLHTSELECRGALEVSKMGAGKTIMALSLVAANPFRSVRAIPWDDPADKRKYLVSRATLIVVRSDLVAQWVAEARKALPPGAKIAQVTTIHDHRALSWNDVLLADVVVVSLTFLQNANYQRRVAKIGKTGGRYAFPPAAYRFGQGNDMWPDFWLRWRQWSHTPPIAEATVYNQLMDAHIGRLHERTRAQFGNVKDCVILERVFWHRIVIDEVHELSHVLCAHSNQQQPKTRMAETLLFCLKARFRLGLTGTPPLMKPACVVSLAEAVGVRNLPTTVADAQAFLNSHVRRNEPDLEIPPVHYQTNWVDLTPAELGLMASYQRQSVRSRLMMCNHHQIHDDVVAATGVTATSVDEVAARIQVVRLDKIELLVKQGRKLQDDIAMLTARMEALVSLIPDDERDKMPAGLTVSDDNRLVVMGADAHERLVRYITAPDLDEAELGIPVEVPRVDMSRVKNLTVDAKTTARKLVTACTEFADVCGQLRTVAAQHRFMATVLSAIAEAEDQMMLGQPIRLCAICRCELDGAGATTRLILQPVGEPMPEQQERTVAPTTPIVCRTLHTDPTAS